MFEIWWREKEKKVIKAFFQEFQQMEKEEEKKEPDPKSKS